MTIVKSAEKFGPPPQALMDEIARYGDQAVKAGKMLHTGGLYPSAMSARVRVAAGKVTVTDGPFTEAKEVVGGFAIFDLASKEEAIQVAREFMELHRKHWPGWEGETEVRPMFDGPPQ